MKGIKMKHIEKIKDYIEKNNNNIFIEVYGTGYAMCNYRLEIDGDNLSCFHERGEQIFSIYENWFHHKNKGKHDEFVKCNKCGLNKGYHYYKMGSDENGIPYLYLYMLDSLQYMKATEIYLSTIPNDK